MDEDSLHHYKQLVHIEQKHNTYKYKRIISVSLHHTYLPFKYSKKLECYCLLNNLPFRVS